MAEYKIVTGFDAGDVTRQRNQIQKTLLHRQDRLIRGKNPGMLKSDVKNKNGENTSILQARDYQGVVWDKVKNDVDEMQRLQEEGRHWDPNDLRDYYNRMRHFVEGVGGRRLPQMGGSSLGETINNQSDQDGRGTVETVGMEADVNDGEPSMKNENTESSPDDYDDEEDDDDESARQPAKRRRGTQSLPRGQEREGSGDFPTPAEQFRRRVEVFVQDFVVARAQLGELVDEIFCKEMEGRGLEHIVTESN
jgi:hypothetical protein